MSNLETLIKYRHLKYHHRRSYIEIMCELLETLSKNGETNYSRLYYTNRLGINEFTKALKIMLKYGLIIERKDNEWKFTRRFFSITQKGLKLLYILQNMTRLLETP